MRSPEQKATSMLTGMQVMDDLNESAIKREMRMHIPVQPVEELEAHRRALRESFVTTSAASYKSVAGHPLCRNDIQDPTFSKAPSVKHDTVTMTPDMLAMLNPDKTGYITVGGERHWTTSSHAIHTDPQSMMDNGLRASMSRSETLTRLRTAEIEAKMEDGAGAAKSLLNMDKPSEYKAAISNPADMSSQHATQHPVRTRRTANFVTQDEFGQRQPSPIRAQVDNLTDREVYLRDGNGGRIVAPVRPASGTTTQRDSYKGPAGQTRAPEENYTDLTLLMHEPEQTRPVNTIAFKSVPFVSNASSEYAAAYKDQSLQAIQLADSTEERVQEQKKAIERINQELLHGGPAAVERQVNAKYTIPNVFTIQEGVLGHNRMKEQEFKKANAAGIRPVPPRAKQTTIEIG